MSYTKNGPFFQGQNCIKKRNFNLNTQEGSISMTHTYTCSKFRKSYMPPAARIQANHQFFILVKWGFYLPDLKKKFGNFYTGPCLPLKFFMPIFFNWNKCNCPFKNHSLNSTFLWCFWVTIWTCLYPFPIVLPGPHSKVHTWSFR